MWSVGIHFCFFSGFKIADRIILRYAVAMRHPARSVPQLLTRHVRCRQLEWVENSGTGDSCVPIQQHLKPIPSLVIRETVAF